MSAATKNQIPAAGTTGTNERKTVSENSITNELTRFDFHGKTVRMVGTAEHPEWIAADVCDILGIAEAKNSLRYLDDDEKGVSTEHTPGGPQQMLTITEPGLYKFLFRSRKAVAKEFTRKLMEPA